ncbi:shieldin complex subunit 2 [Ctenodactylus gundi]
MAAAAAARGPSCGRKRPAPAALLSRSFLPARCPLPSAASRPAGRTGLGAARRPGRGPPPPPCSARPRGRRRTPGASGTRRRSAGLLRMLAGGPGDVLARALPRPDLRGFQVRARGDWVALGGVRVPAGGGYAEGVSRGARRPGVARGLEASPGLVARCGDKGQAQHLHGEEKDQKHQCEKKKITDEQPENQSNICGQNFQTHSSQLGQGYAAVLNLVSGTEQIHARPRAVETKYVPMEHAEIQNLGLEFSSPVVEPQAAGAWRRGSGLRVSTDTEFLSILTCSQVAFLGQRKARGKNSVSKVAQDLVTEPREGPGKVRTPEADAMQPKDDLAERSESGPNQAHSPELFSPVCPKTAGSHTHMNPGTGLEENAGSQELFSCADELPLEEPHIELSGSELLCSQLSAPRSSPGKRSLASSGRPSHSRALSEASLASKKMRLDSLAGDSAGTAYHGNEAAFKGIKTSLIKDCDSKTQKYNCLVMVLTPCQVREVNIKSGPNSGSKVPLATIAVTDQSGIRKKVILWRAAAFWALTVLLGDIIFLTDVTVHEDRWVGETVLQSTCTSQLLNLGNYSAIHPEKHSRVVSNVALQNLLAYVSAEHSYLKDLPQRRPPRAGSVEFVELSQLQPYMLVHAVLRIVDVTVLTEALYNYRGQKQRKVMLTVEQAQGQHYVLVLWGPGAAWYPQLQRKRDYIWEFKYLFVQRNCLLESLELHTTLWSSCECLFDDDVRAIAFRTKFQKSTLSFIKMSDLATHLKEKNSGVVLVKAQILELAFPVAAAQRMVLNTHSSLKGIMSSLPSLTYSGCAKCGLELDTDENKIYRQCLRCLPYTGKRAFYRPALMTVADEAHSICIQVGPKLMEKILLNIPPDYLRRAIVPSSEVTYGMVAADLLHALLADGAEPCLLKIQSLFLLDENSCPLQQDFSLQDFCPASCGAWSRLGPSMSQTVWEAAAVTECSQ